MTGAVDFRNFLIFVKKSLSLMRNRINDDDDDDDSDIKNWTRSDFLTEAGSLVP